MVFKKLEEEKPVEGRDFLIAINDETSPMWELVQCTCFIVDGYYYYCGLSGTTYDETAITCWAYLDKENEEYLNKLFKNR